MKSLLLSIPLLFIMSTVGFKDPQRIRPANSSSNERVTTLKNGFYWISRGNSDEVNVKMVLAKFNKSYLVNDKMFITQSQIKSMEVSTVSRNRKNRDLLNITFDSVAAANLTKIDQDMFNPLELALVLNNKLVLVAKFFGPFKGNKMDFSSTTYSKADLIEIKKTFDGLK